jgi:hypothetical protein
LSCSCFDVFMIACRPLRATTKKRKHETSEEFWEQRKEARNFRRILRRKKDCVCVCVCVCGRASVFFWFDEQRWRSGSEESCSSAEASVRLFVRR